MADRLGVIYTPNEIVHFIVESAEWLCQKHFKKRLIDRNVEILEPAAGTGTFVTELIDFFRRQPARLKEKYLDEIHAVNLLAYDVRHRHEGIGIFGRNLFGGEALDAIARVLAAVEEWRLGPRSMQGRRERNRVSQPPMPERSAAIDDKDGLRPISKRDQYRH